MSSTFLGTVMRSGLVHHATKAGAVVHWKDDLGVWRAAGGKVRLTFVPAGDFAAHEERIQLLRSQFEVLDGGRADG